MAGIKISLRKNEIHHIMTHKEGQVTDCDECNNIVKRLQNSVGPSSLRRTVIGGINGSELYFEHVSRGQSG